MDIITALVALYLVIAALAVVLVFLGVVARLARVSNDRKIVKRQGQTVYVQSRPHTSNRKNRR